MAAIENEHIYGVTIRESATDGSDFTNPDADYRRLFLGEDGMLHVKDSAGAVTAPYSGAAEITDIATAEMDDTLVLAPDGTGGVEFRAEAGGGVSPSYLGYNTAGGSSGNFVGSSAHFLKKITPGANQVLLSVGVYMAMTSAATAGFPVSLWSDSAGSPGAMLATGGVGVLLIGHASSVPGWYDFPLAYPLTSGTSYWIGVGCHNNPTNWQIYYDGSGSDGIYTEPYAANVGDYTGGSWAAGSNKYSIRALVI